MSTIRIVAVLITGLAETGAGREGIIYAGLMSVCDLDTFQSIVTILVDGGLIKRGAGHLLTITGSGRELAAKIEASMLEASSS